MDFKITNSRQPLLQSFIALQFYRFENLSSCYAFYAQILLQKLHSKCVSAGAHIVCTHLYMLMFVVCIGADA